MYLHRYNSFVVGCTRTIAEQERVFKTLLNKVVLSDMGVSKHLVKMTA